MSTSSSCQDAYAVSPSGNAAASGTRYARSSSPARSASVSSPTGASRTDTWTPGNRRWKVASSAGRSTQVSVWMVPMATRPVARPVTAATACRASSAPASSARARGTSARPASVSTTRRPVRSNSSAPSSRSRLRTDELSADCTISSRRAAAVKPPSVTTAMKWRSWRISIGPL